MRIVLRKKTKRKLLISIPLAILTLAAGWIIFHPAVPVKAEYKIFSLEGESGLEDSWHRYDANEYYYQRVCSDIETMSAEASEYCTISLNFEFLNLLPVKVTNFIYFIEGETSDSPVIGKWDYGFPPVTVEGWTKGAVSGMSIFFYRDGRTDAEVADYLKGLTIKINYASKINSEHTLTIRLGEYLEDRGS